MQIAPKLKRHLEKLARQRGVTVDTLLWGLLAVAELEHVREDSELGASCFELAQAAGVIGVADDLPCDLSTNPAHLDGFGRE